MSYISHNIPVIVFKLKLIVVELKSVTAAGWLKWDEVNYNSCNRKKLNFTYWYEYFQLL